MVTEGINILPANVINIGVDFGTVISPSYNRSEVLTMCLSALKTYLSTDSMSIGSPLVMSDMQAVLQNVPGVISIYKFEMKSFFGGAYNSDINFVIRDNTKNGILYCPKDAVFEVKYPDMDIVGESK